MSEGTQQEKARRGGQAQDGHERKMYLKFATMIITSTVIMFGLMYIEVHSADHLRWSETRFFMALIMGAR